MSLSLTVVTHTNSRHPRDASACLASVQAALIERCRHVVIPLDTDLDGFIAARYAAMQLDEVVAFVDDDDTIAPDALRLCLAALEGNSLGVAFTDCMVQCADGIARQGLACPTYNELLRYPAAMHHLVAVRSEYVTARSLALAQQHGCGIEWIMKAEAALTQGAVHIPYIGYYYVKHPQQQQLSGQAEVRQRFVKAVKPIGTELKAWARFEGAIVDYHPDL